MTRPLASNVEVCQKSERYDTSLQGWVRERLFEGGAPALRQRWRRCGSGEVVGGQPCGMCEGGLVAQPLDAATLSSRSPSRHRWCDGLLSHPQNWPAFEVSFGTPLAPLCARDWDLHPPAVRHCGCR